MKTTLNIIIATVLLAVATSATAKSWRINNNAAAAPDFVSINAAMSSDDVLAGDTLYLDPATSLSGEQTVSKQVTIVGPGYFRTDTPHAFAYLQDALTINAASTKVEGVIMLNEIRIRAQDVTIERCKYTTIVIGNSFYHLNAQFAKIRQCYVQDRVLIIIIVPTAPLRTVFLFLLQLVLMACLFRRFGVTTSKKQLPAFCLLI